MQLEAQMLYDLCHNRYDCVPVINRLCYKVPVRTHCRVPGPLFATPRTRTNAGKRSPLFRLVQNYNENFNTVDILAARPGAFKESLLCLLLDS